MHKNKKRTSAESVFSTLIVTIKQAFKINKRSLPWTKAISAGICAAIPVLLGLVLGNFQYGLLAGIGSFTYLYVMNEPYSQRAKKLFFVLLGMTLSVGLGTLASAPLASAIMVGIIGTIATFIFGALKIPGPAGIFFILGFLMSTGMPVDPALAPLRAGLVFLGGVLSWGIGMIGWFLKPYGPETIAVKKGYKELASLMDSVGTENFNESRQRLVFALKAADDTLLAGFISRRSSDQYKRLLLLNKQANASFTYILEHFADGNAKLPPELGMFVRAIANSIDNQHKRIDMTIRQPEQVDEAIHRLFSKIFDAEAIMNEPIVKVNQELKLSKPTLKTIFLGAFDKNSIIFLTSIRYGFIITIADLIAHSFDFDRSYWVTLSCAAVMSGSTIVSTLHRAIQRSIGTIAGILLAAIILSVKPEGIVIVVAIMLLTFLTELAIVLNYGIAALFITPNALLLAESSTHLYDISYFSSTRIIDVIIGSVIGLIGTLLIGRRQASSLLPHLMAKTIRSQQQFLLLLFSQHGSQFNAHDSIERRKMQTNLTNLKLMYTTALGEISIKKKPVEFLQPAMFSIEQLGYLLESCLHYDHRPVLSDVTIAQFLLIFEKMAKSAEQQWPLSTKSAPEIQGFSKIQKEINDLQNALQISEKAPVF